MSEPTVSVIIPCHDHGRFLSEAIDSVHAQTYRDFEIVIVDDGSTDPSTVAVLDRIEEPKIRKLRIEHAGVMVARNVGIRESAGRYLCFFDSDDRMHPEFLERTVSVLDNDPSLAFASCWVRLFGDESWDWKPEHWEFPWLLHECSVATAALVRSDVVRKIGGYDERMKLGHEDWDLWLDIVERGYRGTIVREILFFYRRVGDSRSTVADRGGTYLEIYRDLLEKHQAAFRRHFFDLLWLKESVVGPELARLHELELKDGELLTSVSRLNAEVEAAVARRLGH